MVREKNRTVDRSVATMFEKMEIFAVIVLIAMCSFSCLAVAATPNNTGDRPVELPTIEGIEIVQGGGSHVFIEINGKSMTMPQLRREESNYIELFFPKIMLPAGTWEREYDEPLIKNIKISQEDRGVSFTINTNAMMEIKEIKGVAPANRIGIALKEKNNEKKTEKMSVVNLANPMDPLNNNTSVTLELRDSELRQVFFMLGKMMGMNIICDPSVPTDPVTVSLKGVPMKEAFAYLMRMYDVSYAFVGQTLLVGKRTEIAKALGKEVTRSFHIAYAKMDQVAPLLQGLVDIDKVVVDNRLREIYVTASPETLAQIESTLEKIDHPGRQVMIQARIVELNENADDNFNSAISHVYKHWFISYGAGGLTTGAIDANYPYPPGRAEGTPAIPVGTTATQLADGLTRMLDVSINKLVKEDKAVVLAKPSLIAIEGEKAKVELTQETQYISGRDEAGNYVYSSVEAGPTLEFLASIGREGMVNIEMKLETGSYQLKDTGGFFMPEKQKRAVDTKIRVRNGELFVIGGLYGINKSEGTTEFPILSNIPLLGDLFKIKTKTNKKTQVVMVVVPFILDVPEEVLSNQI